MRQITRRGAQPNEMQIRLLVKTRQELGVEEAVAAGQKPVKTAAFCQRRSGAAAQQPPSWRGLLRRRHRSHWCCSRHLHIPPSSPSPPPPAGPPNVPTPTGAAPAAPSSADPQAGAEGLTGAATRVEHVLRQALPRQVVDGGGALAVRNAPRHLAQRGQQVVRHVVCRRPSGGAGECVLIRTSELQSDRPSAPELLRQPCQQNSLEAAAAASAASKAHPTPCPSPHTPPTCHHAA